MNKIEVYGIVFLTVQVVRSIIAWATAVATNEQESRGEAIIQVIDILFVLPLLGRIFGWW